MYGGSVGVHIYPLLRQKRNRKRNPKRKAKKSKEKQEGQAGIQRTDRRRRAEKTWCRDEKETPQDSEEGHPSQVFSCSNRLTQLSVNPCLARPWVTPAARSSGPLTWSRICRRCVRLSSHVKVLIQLSPLIKLLSCKEWSLRKLCERWRGRKDVQARG